MSEKYKYWRLIWPTGAIEITTLDGVANVIHDYMDGTSLGEQWILEPVAMTDEEYDALPEFMGP